MDVRLILDSGKLKGSETKLARGVYLVGRSKSCQIRPKNKSVSRNHCALIHRKSELLLQDIGSKHGTFLNGKRIDQGVAISVSDGDKLQVGQTRFIFSLKHRKRRPTAMPPQEQSESHSHSAGSEQSPVALQEPDLHDAEAVESPVVAKSANSGPVPPSSMPESEADIIDDILSLLEEDEQAVDEEDDDDLPNDNVGEVRADHRRTSQNVDGDADLSAANSELDDDDEGVDFIAPSSGGTLSVDEPIPAYKLRHDWDVNSVQKWVGKKQAAAPPKKLPQRKFKLKDKKKAALQRAEEKAAEERRKQVLGQRADEVPGASWVEWLNSESVRPMALGVAIVLFVAWMIYNMWVLYSFDG